MVDRITWLEQEIKAMEDHMYIQSMANDFYNTKGDYKKDKKYLEDLQRQLNNLMEEENNKNVIPFVGKVK